jgi:hypothetical protein
LHNLKRVEAGLRGEHLGADLPIPQFGGEGLVGFQVGGSGRRRRGTKAANGTTGSSTTDTEMKDGGWQDREEFEREQDIARGDVGGLMQNVFDLAAEKDEEVPRVEETKSTGDKEARRQRKREKRLKEKRAKGQASKRERGVNS